MQCVTKFDYILTTEYSKVQQSFALQLAKFKFKTIGEEKTEDEQLISELIGYDERGCWS